MNSRPVSLKSLTLETIVVGTVGLCLALLANHFSPRGLVLTRDYFGGSPGRAPLAAAPAGTLATNSAAPVAAAPGLEAELQREGFRIVTTDDVLRLHRDPRREQGFIVLVDARDDRHYAEGHIPGAIQLDHFYPEKNLAEVLALCTLAEEVVVYCTGGDCTDSHLAARLLKEAGVPAERLGVFVGGITEWKARRSPVEIGGRNSGDLRTP